MTIETAQRIKWRLEETGRDDFKLKDVRIAIMQEAGLDDRTVDKYIKRMIELGMIKRLTRWKFELVH